jgi:hypothetical protein
VPAWLVTGKSSLLLMSESSLNHSSPSVRRWTIALKKQSHWLLLPLPAYGTSPLLWKNLSRSLNLSAGHVKPLVVLATRAVVENSNLIVTMLLSPNHIDKVHIELSRLLPGQEKKAALQRIRSVLQRGEMKDLHF